MVARVTRGWDVRLMFEPGRLIAGNAGVLLSRVGAVKTGVARSFVVLDAAMNDLMRPALYNATHPITRAQSPNHPSPDHKSPIQHSDVADIVGPVCETGDCFLRDWPIGDVRAGDVLIIWGAGAYGFAIANNYNSRPRPAEVLVEGARARLIRRRESPADLLRGE